MSEFFDAQILRCPRCRTRFASCEGPLCDCYAEVEEEDEEDEEESTRDDLASG
jgi:hypothetical protein